MNVRVRFFAAFRDATGVDVEVVSTEARTAGNLFSEMTRKFPGLHHEPAALVAINDEMSTWDSGFSEGDEILFFPPVAGG
jgi:MoaD family protein